MVILRQNTPIMRQYYTPKQVGEMLQVDLPYVYGLMKSNQIQAFDILPGVTRITSDSIDLFVERRAAAGTSVYIMPEEFNKLPQRAWNVLQRLAMFNSVEDLTQYSRKDWMRFRGVGENTVNEIEQLCQEHNMELAAE